MSIFKPPSAVNALSDSEDDGAPKPSSQKATSPSRTDSPKKKVHFVDTDGPPKKKVHFVDTDGPPAPVSEATPKSKVTKRPAAVAHNTDSHDSPAHPETHPDSTILKRPAGQVGSMAGSDNNGPKKKIKKKSASTKANETEVEEDLKGPTGLAPQYFSMPYKLSLIHI